MKVNVVVFLYCIYFILGQVPVDPGWCAAAQTAQGVTGYTNCQSSIAALDRSQLTSWYYYIFIKVFFKKFFFNKRNFI